jgi:sugar lactone lactonase YvrE
VPPEKSLGNFDTKRLRPDAARLLRTLPDVSVLDRKSMLWCSEIAERDDVEAFSPCWLKAMTRHCPDDLQPFSKWEVSLEKRGHHDGLKSEKAPHLRGFRY